MDNSNIKGAVAEQAIVLAATKLGVPVLRPVSEHGRSDLAFDIGGRLWRVQVKWGRLSTAGDVIYVKLMTQRCTPRGYVRRKYGESEIDLFAVYCGELNRSFLIPSDRAAGMAQFMLRVAPALNSQRACINLADDFAFDGAIAQLGERSAGSRKVAGSNPASSITEKQEPTVVGSNLFRDRFGYYMHRAASGDEVLVTFRGKPRVRLSRAAG